LEASATWASLWLAVIALAALLGVPIAMRRAGIQRDIAVGVAACLAIGVSGGLSSLTRVFVTRHDQTRRGDRDAECRR
jgi:cyanate permease